MIAVGDPFVATEDRLLLTALRALEKRVEALENPEGGRGR
jgi:hypothetical protein